MNNTKKLYIEIGGKALAFVSFFESSSYYFFYGACYREIDTYSRDALKPYIIRMNKDLNDPKLHLDERENIGNTPYYTTMMVFIHGQEDTFVPKYMGLENYEACGSEKELKLFDGAEHARSLFMHQEEYKRCVLDFLAKHF